MELKGEDCKILSVVGIHLNTKETEGWLHKSAVHSSSLKFGQIRIFKRQTQKVHYIKSAVLPLHIDLWRHFQVWTIVILSSLFFWNLETLNGGSENTDHVLFYRKTIKQIWNLSPKSYQMSWCKKFWRILKGMVSLLGSEKSSAMSWNLDSLMGKHTLDHVKSLQSKNDMLEAHIPFTNYRCVKSTSTPWSAPGESLHMIKSDGITTNKALPSCAKSDDTRIADAINVLIHIWKVKQLLSKGRKLRYNTHTKIGLRQHGQSVVFVSTIMWCVTLYLSACDTEAFILNCFAT